MSAYKFKPKGLEEKTEQKEQKEPSTNKEPDTVKSIKPVKATPNFDRYYQLLKERQEKERIRRCSRHLYSSDEETNAEEEQSVAPDDDLDSYDEWSEEEEETGGDTYDPSEFDRHR